MPGVTKEQIEKAKEWDLLSYQEAYEPQERPKPKPPKPFELPKASQFPSIFA